MKRRPPIPHPLDLALRARFAREAGLDPAQLAAWLEWREPAPRSIADRLVAAFYPLVPPDSLLVEGDPLPSEPDTGTIGAHMQTESLRIRGPSPSKHPFTDALRNAGVSVAEFARAHKLSRGQVKSWFLGGATARRIPKSMAETIKKEYGVPFSAWKNGIEDSK